MRARRASPPARAAGEWGQTRGKGEAGRCKQTETGGGVRASRKESGGQPGRLETPVTTLWNRPNGRGWGGRAPTTGARTSVAANAVSVRPVTATPATSYPRRDPLPVGSAGRPARAARRRVCRPRRGRGHGPSLLPPATAAAAAAAAAAATATASRRRQAAGVRALALRSRRHRQRPRSRVRPRVAVGARASRRRPGRRDGPTPQSRVVSRGMQSFAEKNYVFPFSSDGRQAVRRASRAFPRP